MMEASGFRRTLILIYQAARHYIPENKRAHFLLMQPTVLSVWIISLTVIKVNAKIRYGCVWLFVPVGS